MLETISAPSHVAAFRVVGAITAEDFDTIIPQIEKKLAEHRKIGVFVEMTDMSMTAGAIARDLQYGMSKLGQLDHFSRAAIVTEEEWIKALAEMADEMFPQIEMRMFPHAERDVALAWAAEV